MLLLSKVFQKHSRSLVPLWLWAMVFQVKQPARLQKNAQAVAIARYFLEAGKPVAAICHGLQVLIPSGLLAGRTATCYRGMAPELKSAGVDYRDREVVVDGNLITSRQPADLPAFMRAIFEALGLA